MMIIKESLGYLTFRKYFPLARLAPMAGGYLVPQSLEQVLHLCPSLSFGDLVAVPQCWGAAVRRVCLRRVCFAGQ